MKRSAKPGCASAVVCGGRAVGVNVGLVVPVVMLVGSTVAVAVKVGKGVIVGGRVAVGVLASVVGVVVGIMVAVGSTAQDLASVNSSISSPSALKNWEVSPLSVTVTSIAPKSLL